MVEEDDLLTILIFNLKLKKLDYERMHRLFIKDRAGPTIHFSKGMIEGLSEAIKIAEQSKNLKTE